ncbi:tyrosine-protein phosphatase [Planococcus shenhongbingii]|uniref:Tyrosine-protein phosphatase n=1 Tax=Planococcus shenhongbingii TaxID=3058398 RepID=A0ABT8N9X0_9BACL|nr:CpsB/CapC family capsule biosynthesis tyrosine phosphatase [Planococcus sp. N017]MDN7244691.1 capsular biosynthesis protein [Planococcus sp. N017]
MIDTHSHILAGIDDGAETMEETKQLLDKALEEGLTGIIATPHAYHPNYSTNVTILRHQLAVTKDYITEQNLPIEVYSGNECRLSDKLPEQLKAGQALPLADSRYVLLELPSSGVPAYTVPIIQQLIADNWVPIIAHAERNQGIIEKPERLEKLLLHGALAQVTSGSIVGSFGKAIQKSAFTLLDANLIHVYGSDVHNMSKRPFLFKEGLAVLEKKKHHELIEILLSNNECIIHDKPMTILEPLKSQKGKWWNIFL